MCVYGYARISTAKQSIDRQIRNIKRECPDAVIVQEAYTGTKLERKEWGKLFKAVKSGDTIIFDSVSRMSRNAEEGFSVYEELFNKGVNLIFLKERHIDTSTYRKALESSVPMTGTAVDCILKGINRYLLTLAAEQIRLAFLQSEKEVEDLHQRTKEGIQTARLNGKQIGQKPGAKLTTKKSVAAKKIIQKYSKDFDGTLGDVEVMKLCGLARNTYYKYKKEMRGISRAFPFTESKTKSINYKKHFYRGVYNLGSFLLVCNGQILLFARPSWIKFTIPFQKLENDKNGT